MGKHREQKQAAHVAKFQQKQSEHARKFNALDKSILGNFSDGTNYTLSGKAVGFGSRDFCVGALALNCIQVRLELETIRNNITQQLTFELARAIESEKKLVVKKGNSHEENRANAFTYAFTQTCMDEDKLTDVVNKLVEIIFSPNMDRDTQQDTGCTHISLYMKHLRYTMYSSTISEEACKQLQRQMDDAFFACIDEAISKTGLVYLAFLSVIVVGYPIYKGYEKAREKYNLPDIFGACKRRRVSAYSGNEPYAPTNA